MCARAEALLFMASRAELIDRRVIPLLQEGGVAILDRFTHSTMAYQGAGRFNNNADDLTFLRYGNNWATNNLVPDRTYFLHAPLDTLHNRMRSRGKLDRMEQQERDFHDRVHAAYERMAAEAAQDTSGRILLIDASPSAEEVFEKQIKPDLNRMLGLQ